MSIFSCFQTRWCLQTILSRWLNHFRNRHRVFSRPGMPALIPIASQQRRGRKAGQGWDIRPVSESILWWLMLAFLLLLGTRWVLGAEPQHNGGITLGYHHTGIGIGNSRYFNGLRINFRDRQVQEIKGINLTFWYSNDNKEARVEGLSIGVMPNGGYLKGVSLGLVGIGADHSLSGLQVGMIGIGAGNNMSGIAIGGIGVGSGGNITGISFGGIGVGSGMDLRGIAIGGIGAGAGQDLIGLSIAGVGLGAGRDARGIFIAGIGGGAGRDMTGLGVSLIGMGAGRNLKGIYLAGIGVGGGQSFTGLAITGIGAGAPDVKGILLSGIAAGGQDVQGIIVSGAMTRIIQDGQFKGLGISIFNQVRGRQSGITLGVVNYARELNGVQLGLINYVRDNPRGLKVLPLFNFHFD